MFLSEKNSRASIKDDELGERREKQDDSRADTERSDKIKKLKSKETEGCGMIN